MYLNAYNNAQYAQRAVCSKAGGSLAVGSAIKLTGLSTGPTDIYNKVDQAGDKDQVWGVVRAQDGRLLPITDTNVGQVVPLNSNMIIVLLAADTTKGTKIKVTTADGKFGAIAMGETPIAILVEDGKKDALAWAVIL